MSEHKPLAWKLQVGTLDLRCVADGVEFVTQGRLRNSWVEVGRGSDPLQALYEVILMEDVARLLGHHELGPASLEEAQDTKRE